MAANTDHSNNPDGVYKNPRLMHACTSIVGYTVHVQTRDGTVHEGIFATFSPNFTICLDLALPIDPKLNSKDCLYAALKSGSRAAEQKFFELADIVRISAIDVDLNYAAKDLAKLTTDADISGYDPNKSNSANFGEQRQLESWQDDDGDNINAQPLLSLDEFANSAGGNGTGKNDSRNSSRGWDAQDMFKYNERVHKVTSTYDEKLTDYTLPLPKHSTKDWRKKQERAAAIAKEIESNTKSQNRLAKEDDDGDDEEEKFSAVLRPIPNATASSTSEINSNNNAPSSTTNTNITTPSMATGAPTPAIRPILATNQKQRNIEISPDSSGQHSQSAPMTHQTSQQQQHQHHHQNQHQPQQHHYNQQQHDHNQHTSHHNQQQHHHQHHHHQQQHTNSSDDNNIRQSSPATNQSFMNKPGQPKVFMNNQNGTYKNRRLDRRIDSLKNFGKQLNITPSPRQQMIQNQMPNSPNSNIQQQSQHQAHQHSQPKQLHPGSHQQHPNHNHPPGPQQQSHGIPLQQQQQPQATSQQQLTQTSSASTASTQVQAGIQTQADIHITTTGSPSTTTTTTSVNTSTISERSDTSSSGNIGPASTANANTNPVKDQQSEIARKSKLNPNAKEFVYKPKSPSAAQASAGGNTQMNGSNQGATVAVAPSGIAAVDPNNSSPMSQQPPAMPYYQQVQMFPHGLSTQQQHHAAQFMPNAHFPQSHIHYMPAHFTQQMPQRFYRGSFQNYHYRGEHHGNIRAEYTQAPIMAAVPTSTGQPYATQPPAGAPHPMSSYPASPQQAMIYSGPPQSMYPVVQAGFPQHMAHVMPNPPPYDGSTVYMPSQNYIVNPQ